MVEFFGFEGRKTWVKPKRSLVFKQRADAGLVRQGEPIAWFQAGVNVNPVTSQRGGGIAGNLILLQEENPLLQIGRASCRERV